MPFPSGFESRIKEIYPDDHASVLSGYFATRLTSFRLNFLRSDAQETFLEFQSRGLSPVPFASLPGAYTLDSSDEYSLKGSNAFYSGRIYVQSLSSQCPPVVLAEPFANGNSGSSSNVNPIRILDATAAPGWKTTQLASIFGNSARIDACERSPVRFDRMAHNVRLQGAENLVTLHRLDVMALHKVFEPETFDAILLDAPCSADGRFRPEDERTFAYWDESVPKKRAKTQMEMLSQLVPLLKKGWTLVYSTCTLAPEENEAVVSSLLTTGEFDVENIELEFPWAHPWILSFRGTAYHRDVLKTVRIPPSALSEGFFVAKLRKREK